MIIDRGLFVAGLIVIVVVLLVQAAGDDIVLAEPLEITLALEPVAEDLERPVLLVGTGDDSGDRFVAQQNGRIVRLDAAGQVQPEPLLDLSDRVLDHHERGLLGLALHPGFGQNGRFFVAYSQALGGATAISEFTVPGPPDEPAIGDELDEPVPVERTERPLLVIAQPYTTHKGGMLAFDGEGMLLISTGDGGSAYDPHDNALDPASLLGKLLRIDVDRGWPYAIPEGNGWAGQPGARGEVHAIGLRNPWRYSVDPVSGDIYIGDVGQSAWEEVDVLRPGERQVSFGWNQLEGEGCLLDKRCVPSDHLGPALVYAHVDEDTGHCAIIGGYAYRGTAASLPDGSYLYGDYCSGTIWAVPVEQLTGGDATPAEVGHLDPGLGQIQGFGQDDAGELYLLTSLGNILHISEAERSLER